MCGIAGRIDWNNPVKSDSVSRMCEKMKYRGPDDSGIVCLNNAALGHRRLSIIDLSHNASQPMACCNNRYFIVYNGEVYNFQALRNELENSGVIFKTFSDTEVILYAYINWGIKCLDKFNGMFALAVWDEQKKELFLARDRFGKKPLYYYRDPGKLIFASELNALLCDQDVPRDVSYEALNSYLALGYILSPLTVYKDVFKLEASTYLLISDKGNKVTKIRYWNYADRFRVKSRNNENDIASDLLVYLDEAVRKRMVSDVPVGAFLSGGIDSSSVVESMRNGRQGQLHTFSVGFTQGGYDESSDARQAAEWMKTIHHDKVCSAGTDSVLFNDAINAFDEPFADTSLIPTFELSKLASSYVKVALSGDGADEIFAGYITYVADRYYPYTKLLPGIVKKLLMRMPEYLAQSSKRKKISSRYKQGQFFYGSLHPAEQAHYLWRIIFKPEERVAILGQNYRDLIYDTDPYLTFKKYYSQTRDLHWLDRHLYVDAMTWMTDDILVKVDRASMRNSLEVRSPYLDVDLASFAASIPAELKLKGLTTKYILKKALRNKLPGFILKKKKSGFNAPVGDWIGYRGDNEFQAFNQFVLKKYFRKGPAA
ncbi:MAG: asparagine synthase (glutamine-hydrolyzing) [Candidatus Omnitrophica bacterium]|nr:asparagine synthase (glutamine-hydrolyzing) [Candidatus Omnitrophota bacterium]